MKYFIGKSRSELVLHQSGNLGLGQEKTGPILALMHTERVSSL